MRKLVLATALAFAAWAAPATADNLLDTQKYGAWTTTAIAETRGTVKCTMRAEWDDGSTLMIHRFAQAGVVAELQAPYWDLRDGAVVPIRVTFGTTFFNIDTTTMRVNNTSLLVFTLPAGWFERFTASDRLEVEYVGSREPTWTMSLSGSRAAHAYWQSCVNAAGDLERTNAGTTPVSTDPFHTKS